MLKQRFRFYHIIDSNFIYYAYLEIPTSLISKEEQSTDEYVIVSWVEDGEPHSVLYTKQFALDCIQEGNWVIVD